MARGPLPHPSLMRRTDPSAAIGCTSSLSRLTTAKASSDDGRGHHAVSTRCQRRRCAAEEDMRGPGRANPHRTTFTGVTGIGRRRGSRRAGRGLLSGRPTSPPWKPSWPTSRGSSAGERRCRCSGAPASRGGETGPGPPSIAAAPETRTQRTMLVRVGQEVRTLPRCLTVSL